ncbi:prephenate dehydrogenase/arogenate dehydrogenase family protein [Tepidiforma flava]|uniref:Prephenate dehydrogenase/arogenate dehydrogenase family protein n=1 Tax=Tepidiforma flava TaxID=3004094 RepID=A0ABY7M6V0_9CHLR|nr:prephenate dehydrogenase/arogenate dehydrogenase family protein [Tepidiforma flava]WBL35764.1 prephenate dehydrogenase/arogenate dehydrogenase family protein [Tepidiforma flava]
MADNRIAIIGTGLIGTSIGLGLAARPNRNYELVGIDRDRAAARTAKKLGALDREVGSLEEAVERAGLVIIATPVMAARRILEDLGRFLMPGAVVTDVCSTKAEVMRWAAEYLPETAHFVGGHPMAGKEKSGPEAASASLFEGATWAVTPSPRADERAVQAVLGLVETLGAIPLYIDPAEHDQYAAAVSHVPLIASVALFRMVRDSQGWEDAALLAGPGFRDMTRLASGDPTMARDIMLTNREAVLHWIGRLEAELRTIRTALESGAEPVYDLFYSTQLDRDTFIQNPPQRRRPEGAEPPSARDAIGRMFVGGLYDKIKEASDRLPAAPRDDRELKRKLGIEDERP